MKYKDALSLMNFLKLKCPYDTGNLMASIQAPQGTEKEWIIVIGNDDTSINGTASNKYASLLNFEQTIKGRNNKHYQWVNKAIKEWMLVNGFLNLTTEVEANDQL